MASKGTPATALLTKQKVTFTLGQRSRLPIAVDASAADLPAMYVSAGRRGLQVSVAPDDLVRLTGATVAPIAS